MHVSLTTVPFLVSGMLAKSITAPKGFNTLRGSDAIQEDLQPRMGAGSPSPEGFTKRLDPGSVFIQKSAVSFTSAVPTTAAPDTSTSAVAAAVQDVVTVDQQLTKLNAVIHASSPSLQSLQEAQTTAQALTDAMHKGTKDFTALQSPVNNAAGQQIVGNLTKTGATNKELSDRMIQIHDFLAGFGAASQVEASQKKFAADSAALNTALVAKLPASLKTKAQAVTDSIKSDIQRVIAAYAS